MSLPPDLVTGHTIIDLQHTRILGALARLKISGDIDGCLLDVAGYMTEHFTYEEVMAEELDFPGIEQHRGEHLKLFDRWTFMRAAWRLAGDSYREQFICGIIGWVGQHVLEHDKELARWIRAYYKPSTTAAT